MAEGKPKTNGRDNGELRRRHRALIDSGILASLGSEGRLMLCYVLYWANFSDGTVRVSARGAAKMLSVHANTGIRGLKQLVDAGVLVKVEERGSPRRSKFELYPPSGAHTLRGHTDHEAWSQRPRSVVTPTTRRVRISSISLCNSKITQREIQSDSAPCRGGSEPPGGGNPSTLLGEEGGGRAVAPVAQVDTLTEEVRSDG